MTGSPRVEDLRRGDIWFVRLGAMDSGGLRKISPCLLLQIDAMNRTGALETVLCVPLSTRIPSPDDLTQFDVLFEPHETGLPKRTAAIWPLLRAVIPQRLIKLTGHVEGEKLDLLARHVAQLVGFEVPRN